MNKATLCLITIGFLLNACCSENFIIPTKDFRETAIDVTDLINDCSADEEFTTLSETTAGEAGSCWGISGSVSSRWFKFKAPVSTDATIIVQIGDEYGTQRKSLMALWDTDGTTELDCSTYSIFGTDDVTINIYYGNLTPDAWYYFSVAAADSQSRGTFTLCLTDTD